jgi:hypothetical protein
MVTVKRSFECCDRYSFDFGPCTYAKGWAQLDTAQDASYYGNWVNPTRRMLLSYAEGDITLTECDTDAEFVAQVGKACEWHEANDGKRPGIDPGLNPAMRDLFIAIGLVQWLH